MYCFYIYILSLKGMILIVFGGWSRKGWPGESDERESSLKNSFSIFKNLNYEKQVRNEKPCIRKKSHGFLAAGLFGWGRRLRKPARWPPAFSCTRSNPALTEPSNDRSFFRVKWRSMKHSASSASKSVSWVLFLKTIVILVWSRSTSCVPPLSSHRLLKRCVLKAKLW